MYANALYYLFSKGWDATNKVKTYLSMPKNEDQKPLFNAVVDSFNMQCKELSKLPELKSYGFEKLVLEK